MTIHNRNKMGCKSVIKYIVFTLDLALILGGLILCGIGINAIFNMSVHVPIMGPQYQQVLIGIIIVGIVTFFTGLLGSIGTYKEKFLITVTCLLNVTMMLVITIALFVIVVFLVIQKVS